MMDQETFTEFENFRRRSNTQQHREFDTLARIEQEAAEYLNRDSAAASMVDDTLASLAARIGNHGIMSPESTLSSSPASDETVMAFNPPPRHGRMTQTRYRGSQSEDPLPPPAPSPQQNTYYPSNAPVYPPTLVTSRSEASMQRAPPSTHDNRVWSSNAGMARNVSYGREESVASVVRKPPTVEFSSSDEGKASDNRGTEKATRHPSSQLQQSKGEQVRSTNLPFCLRDYAIPPAFLHLYSRNSFPSSNIEKEKNLRDIMLM